MRFLEVVFHYVPSSHSLSGEGPNDRSTKLNTIETISKKRTRKVRRTDPNALDTALEEDEAVESQEEPANPQHKGLFRNKRGSQSGAWRPDEDEMCLTTTVIQGKGINGGRKVDEESLEDGAGDEGGGHRMSNMGQVVVTKEFAWDEERNK